MGRRRWRFVTIATFLLFIIKEVQSQDDDEFYYTPVERSFAQVQPPLFSNGRPSYYEQNDAFRVQPNAQQTNYKEGNVRFPSPNYNQNPSPFQLPTGRSQAGTQYYINQAEYNPSQRQRFRPSFPHNYQFIHPVSTKRPNFSQIHSVAYQNNPSQPEAFLGQVTLNNPDIDYLQNSRFKNIPFDNNSLKSNGQTGHIIHDEDIDNHELFEHHKVTTYNPNKFNGKQIQNVKNTNFSLFDSTNINDKINIQNVPNKIFENNHASSLNHKLKVVSSTENKALLELEPFLEDDISDVSSFKELMKNNQGSFDVQVIKPNKSTSKQTDYDSKPDASSMNTDNIVRQIPVKMGTTTTNTPDAATTSSLTTSTSKHSETQGTHLNSQEDDHSEEQVDDEQYVEYYEDGDDSNTPSTTEISTESVTDIYDDYDTADEPEKIPKDVKINNTDSFDIVMIHQPNKSMVNDDNFKEFTDTTAIDQPEIIRDNETTEASLELPNPDKDLTSFENSSILGQEVVSVVTTKSVVNGTISVPDVSFAPPTTHRSLSQNSSKSLNNSDSDSLSYATTTENWIVVASVQTSRSVSGARFLPFPSVEQEEKKQVLTDDELEVETVTNDPHREANETTQVSSSTENINDKLDSIQSELSSSVLSGSLDKQNNNIEIITESTTELTTVSVNVTTTMNMTTMAPSSLNIFTLKSTQLPLSTERSAPDPLPVMIKKFIPRVSTSTTPKPRKKPSLVTVMDDLAGLLPPGYKPRISFKDKRVSTTTTSTTTPEPKDLLEDDVLSNSTQGRSSGISYKNKVIILDDKSLTPKEHRTKQITDPLKKNERNDNKVPSFRPVTISYQNVTEENPSDILEKVKKIDVSDFSPKSYFSNKTGSDKSKTETKLPKNATPIDISAFLPPGFKLNSTANETIVKKIKIADVTNLLPPGFKLDQTEESDLPITTTTTTTTTKAPGGIKLVFPSRPGSKTTRKTTPKPNVEMGPIPVTPKIQKGWPTRASTEFTGWPSPSTTPFSIEKLLEAQRNATATSPLPEVSIEISTRRTTTTSTTTVAPPPSTTPGVCTHVCDIAATIKIVSGVKWVPELLHHHTEEWQRLAKEVKEELNSVYSRSEKLKNWYKGIRIDGFTKGSVLVDYFIELNDVTEKLNTQELKKMFHKSLHEAKPGSVIETIEEDHNNDFDRNVMLGDQPEADRMKKSNEKMTKTIDKSAGKLEIGKFVMDPAYTEFIVLPKRETPTALEPDEESFLPQWGIAVIVIAMASLLFVIIFGVTVLVNRQKSAKAKQPIPLSEDMLRELDKSHMGGLDDIHQMKERDLPYLPSGKRMSTAFIEPLAYPNPGDSWRSEWTPQLQKYMQHYTPDSGRGSQIYGQTGNAYGYGGGGGSQLYGQTGGGSQVYGYTGEYPPQTRSHYSRRRSDYDSNF